MEPLDECGHQYCAESAVDGLGSDATAGAGAVGAGGAVVGGATEHAEDFDDGAVDDNFANAVVHVVVCAVAATVAVVVVVDVVDVAATVVVTVAVTAAVAVTVVVAVVAATVAVAVAADESVAEMAGVAEALDSFHPEAGRFYPWRLQHCYLALGKMETCGELYWKTGWMEL